MSYQCERCLKQCRDNYDLKRHLSRKKQCEIKKTSKENPNVTINITINQQNITNYNVLPDPTSIPKRIVDRAIGMFDEHKPMYTTAKSVVFVKKYLNQKPENRNTNLDPKSAIATVYNGEKWERKTKKEVINNTIKQTARTLSDAVDIVGSEAPETMTECMETIATDSLPTILSTTEISDITNLLTTILIK